MLLSLQPCPGVFGHVRSIKFPGATLGTLSPCRAGSLHSRDHLIPTRLWICTIYGTLGMSSERGKAKLSPRCGPGLCGVKVGQAWDNPGSRREAEHGTRSEILNFCMIQLVKKAGKATQEEKNREEKGQGNKKSADVPLGSDRRSLMG